VAEYLRYLLSGSSIASANGSRLNEAATAAIFFSGRPFPAV
jgi:hypothetical protein